MIKKADSVYVVDIFGDVVTEMSNDLGIEINYVYGDAVDILENLKEKDESKTMKDKKYALLAVYMPFTEERGNEASMLYANVMIRRITLATLSNKDDKPPARYENTFKPILYPMYEAFLYHFARNHHISSKDPNTIIHTKVDIIGTAPLSGINDYVDCINLDNFNFSINQTKYC